METWQWHRTLPPSEENHYLQKNKSPAFGSHEDGAHKGERKVLEDIKTTSRLLIEEAIADLETQFGSRTNAVCLKLAKAAELLRRSELVMHADRKREWSAVVPRQHPKRHDRVARSRDLRAPLLVL
jgi:hypothetical protein